MAGDGTKSILAARESFTGKKLTDSQFDEARLVCGIIKRKIEKTGSFREALTDYAHAFARSERFDAVQAETIIRDVFKALNGRTMNAIREELKARETDVRDMSAAEVLSFARSVPERIKDGETVPFYRAFDAAGVDLAERLGITEQTAKSWMKDIFEEAEGRDLYEVGKETEEAYHRPVREVERGARKAETIEKRQISPRR